MRLKRLFRTPLLAFVVAVLVLCRWMAPGLTFEDAGELAAAASGFGVPHPPGFPLLMLVGGALAKMLAPLGVEPARALVWVSVLSAAACIGLLVRFVSGPKDERPVAGLLVAGMLLASPTFAAQAVVGETYALGAALTAALLVAAERARPAFVGLLFGLAVAAHPASVFLFPLFVFGVLRAGELKRVAGRALLGLGLGLSIYLYVPLAAAREPAVNWGGIDGLGSLVDHLLRRQFSGGPPRDLAMQAAFLAEFLVGQWPLLILVALVFGLRRKRQPEGEALLDPRLPLVSITLFVTALGLFWAQHWPVEEAIARIRLAGSFTPIVVLTAACVGLLCARIEARLDGRLPPPALLLGGLALALFHVAPSYGQDPDTAPSATLAAFRDMSNITEAEAYARAVLGDSPEDAILVVNRLGYSDVLYFPLLYAQVALSLRPDVLVIDRELLGADWYRRQLAAARPALRPALERLGATYAALPSNADARQWRLVSVPFLRELASQAPGIGLIGKPSPRIANGLALSAQPSFWWLAPAGTVAKASTPQTPDWPWLDRTPGAYSDPWRQELVRLASER
jgi:hypothetical protein